MNKVFEKIIEKQEELFQDLNVIEVLSHVDFDSTIQNSLDNFLKAITNEAIEIVKQEAERYNNGWIPVEEQLPKDGDNRYYMCIVENHEEDHPMCCQYDEECGFGFYQDIYDEHTLGFVDCVFQTNEELGYEKVIAWQQLLPYQPKGE